MAGGIFRVSKGDDEQPTLYTEVELVAEFAPGLDTTKASSAKLINEWVAAFAKSEAIQAGYGVKVEKVDARQVFDQRFEAFTTLERDAAAAKKDLVSALYAVLPEVTEAEIAEGETHTLTASSKKKLGLVELFVSKAKVPVKDLLAKDNANFPAHVAKELKSLQKKRSAEAARRLGGGE